MTIWWETPAAKGVLIVRNSNIYRNYVFNRKEQSILPMIVHLQSSDADVRQILDWCVVKILPLTQIDHWFIYDLQATYGADDALSADEMNLKMLMSSVPGTPGEDYPIYSEVPETEFSCEGQVIGGYYADPSTECQVFHVCATDSADAGPNSKWSFLCPNGTIFNQNYFICDWWFNFDCAEAEGLYGLNDQLGGGDDQAQYGEEQAQYSDNGSQSQYNEPAASQNRASYTAPAQNTNRGGPSKSAANSGYSAPSSANSGYGAPADTGYGSPAGKSIQQNIELLI